MILERSRYRRPSLVIAMQLVAIEPVAHALLTRIGRIYVAQLLKTQSQLDGSAEFSTSRTELNANFQRASWSAEYFDWTG